MKISGQNDRFSVSTTSLRPCTRKLRGIGQPLALLQYAQKKVHNLGYFSTFQQSPTTLHTLQAKPPWDRLQDLSCKVVRVRRVKELGV